MWNIQCIEFGLRKQIGKNTRRLDSLVRFVTFFKCFFLLLLSADGLNDVSGRLVAGASLPG